MGEMMRGERTDSECDADELELAKIAVHILTNYTPEDRERARRVYVDAFEETFRRMGREPPAWISRLREEPWER